MKYTNKKTGVIAELVRENEKFKTVDLLKEDGTSTTIPISTLKRWWKAIPEEETTKDEEFCGDGTPLAQVGKETAKQAKDKAKKTDKPANSKNKPSEKESVTNTPTKKKKAVKKGNTKSKRADMDMELVTRELKELIKTKGGTYNELDADGILVWKCHIPHIKSTVMQFTFRKSIVCLSTRSKFLSDKMAGKFRKVNLTFDLRYNFSELNGETKLFINELIDDILENSKKEEK